MTMVHQHLNDTINSALQEYLSIPAEKRTQVEYSQLVDNLARAAMNFATQLNDERRVQMRAQRKGVGRS